MQWISAKSNDGAVKHNMDMTEQTALEADAAIFRGFGESEFIGVAFVPRSLIINIAGLIFSCLAKHMLVSITVRDFRVWLPKPACTAPAAAGGSLNFSPTNLFQNAVTFHTNLCMTKSCWAFID